MTRNLGAMTRNQVGASARRTRTVTRRDIGLFSEITGDRNPVHYGDELAARDDKPVTTLATSVTNQDDVVVLDGTAVIRRDLEVSAVTPPDAGSPAPTQEKIA